MDNYIIEIYLFSIREHDIIWSFLVIYGCASTPVLSRKMRR